MSEPALVERCPHGCPLCAELAGGAAAAAGPGDGRQRPLPFDPPTRDDDPPTAAELVGPVATPRALLSDPVPIGRRLVQALLEVQAGDRPARQLAGCTEEKLLSRIEAGVGRRQVRPWAASVRSVRVCEPADGVAEVSAVVVGLEAVAATKGRTGAGRRRCRAVALRLEGVDGRWMMTALTMG